MDWDRIRQEKATHRATQAALPLDQKLRILERLRDSAKILRESRNVAGVAMHRPRYAPLQVSGTPQLSTGPIRVTLAGADGVFVAAIAHEATVALAESGKRVGDLQGIAP